MSERLYDVPYGASGFVGKQTVKYFASLLNKCGGRSLDETVRS